MSKINIEISNLKKSFEHMSGSITLFKNFNLKIKEGELVALVGPSGSGKSSLLYLLALLDKPTNGKIILNNIDTNNSSSYAIDGKAKIEQQLNTGDASDGDVTVSNSGTYTMDTDSLIAGRTVAGSWLYKTAPCEFSRRPSAFANPLSPVRSTTSKAGPTIQGIRLGEVAVAAVPWNTCVISTPGFEICATM